MSKCARLLICASLIGWVLGCEDINKDFTNTSETDTVVRLTAVIRIGGSGNTFPNMDSWYEDRVPEIASVGFDTHLLTWEVEIPPGESFHVGGSFANSGKSVEFVNWMPEYGTPSAVGPTIELSGLSVRVRDDASLGKVMDAYIVADAPTSVTVQQIDWAVSPSRLPLNSLFFDHPDLQALAWQQAADAVPFDLSPGGPPVVMDIPDGQLSGHAAGLVRAIVTTPEGLSEQAPIFQMLLRQPIPAIAEWGMIVLALSLLSIATLIFSRVRHSLA